MRPIALKCVLFKHIIADAYHSTLADSRLTISRIHWQEPVMSLLTG